MPIHIAPAIRAREEALEAVGLIVPLDSAAVITAKSLESSGLAVKEAPLVTYYFGSGAAVKAYTPVPIKSKG